MHLLLELGHEGSVGREDDVLLLQLHRDEGLALTVVNEDVQAHAENKTRLSDLALSGRTVDRPRARDLSFPKTMYWGLYVRKKIGCVVTTVNFFACFIQVG